MNLRIFTQDQVVEAFEFVAEMEEAGRFDSLTETFGKLEVWYS